MPINPQTYEGVAYGLAEAGAQVTYGVAKALTELHKAIITDPDNLSRAADIYAKRVAKASAEWGRNWRQWADEGLLDAYIQGVKHTDAEIALLRKAGIRVHPPTEPIPEGAVMAKKLPTMTLPLDTPGWMKEAFVDIPNHLTAFNVFRRAAYFALEGTALQIVRKGNDLYRDVAIQAGSQMFREADIFTRRQFSQRMLDDFAQRGIQSITYSNGRKMSIESYSEMVGRTMSGHAAVQGSLNRYAEHGYDLVRVSSHFRACELCVPWEGKVLSSSGQNPDYESLDSAISAGLFHPNCAHDVTPYIPGLSPDQEVRVSKEEQALIDKYGYRDAQEIAYKAQVQQRHIERQIRSWKKRELTALDPTMKTQAHRKVLDWQKAQREHLTINPFLPRKYERESVKDWVAGRSLSGNPAENLANRLFARAQRVEPEITGIISRVAEENGVTLKGLEFRLKTRESLARKLASEYRDNVAASYKIIEKNLGDSIRYTYVIEESQYSKAVMKISEDLKAQGFVPYDSKFKNYWNNPSYKGINSNWMMGDQLLEIQFHTPESLLVKEEKSHKIYEKQRVETDPVKIKAYAEEMAEIWRGVPVPEGVDWLNIDGWKGGGW
jgi:hypothetical protein